MIITENNNNIIDCGALSIKEVLNNRKEEC
jgi:hypothetical protein